MQPITRPAATYPLVYHDGELVAWEAACVHAGSLALRYALSVFEGVRIYRRDEGGVAPFALREHLDRLRNSLALVRLPAPGEDVAAVVAELIERNAIAEDAYVRIAVNAVNPGEMSAAPKSALTVTVTRMGRKPWLAQGRRMRVAVSPWQRASGAVFPSAAKCIGNYAGPRLALLQAKDEGYDSVILTTADGHLSEAPSAALFLCREGELLTPALADNCLPSITRALLLELAGELGLRAREARLTAADAYACDEAFLCGTGIELAPIASFDGRPVANEAAPVTAALVEAYFARARGARRPSAVPS